MAKLPVYLAYDDVLLLPNYSEVTPSKVNTEVRLTPKITLSSPILSATMDTVTESKMAIAMAKMGGYGVIHRNLSIEDEVAELKKVQAENLHCGVAVGTGADLHDRVKALVEAGAQEICIDSAHGHTKHVMDAVRHIKETYPEVEVIAGNVATYEGARDLFAAGADSVKVGMGPGSICTTRVMSGMGAPQLSAVIDCVRAGKEAGKTIIADGGVRTSGDMTKAMAAGATAIMLGSMLAGTDEAPGEVIMVSGEKFKVYRGMGSVAAMQKGSASRYGQDSNQAAKKLVPEGVEALVPYKGSAEEIVYQMMGGLRAGMAYLGANNLTELAEKARFVKISEAGVLESKPHSIIQTSKSFVS
ncbi:MAG: IMP dehydrogenase [Pseudomonadales bacterium]|nr:IMP dehydrogenase [Pseudomonadales bacterium]